MYIKEMHIEVNQSVQKLAANRTRKIYTEEMDWLLNKNIARFIKLHVKPKENGSVELTQLGQDALRKLTVFEQVLPANYASGGIYRAPLPYQYAHLLSDQSIITQNCGKPSVQTTTNKYLTAFPIPKSPKTAQPYYEKLELYINGTKIIDLQSVVASKQGTYTGLSSREEVFTMRNFVLEQLVEKGYEVYWEQYDQTYREKHIILVTSSPIILKVIVDSLELDSSSSDEIHQSVISQHTHTVSGIASQQVENRLTPLSSARLQMNAAFWKTQYDSPISILENSNLRVYTDENFIVNSLVITYLRKIKKVSLILEQDCEIAEDYHPEICDMTSEYIKGMLADPGWEQKLRDNMARTTI